MELSSLEIGKQVKLVREQCGGYYVNKISQVGRRCLAIRLHKSETEDKLLVIAVGLGFWLSSKTLPMKPPEEGFFRRAAVVLDRSIFVTAEQVEGERIVKFFFEKNNINFSLLLEFFASGNFLILDSDDKILDLHHVINVRHRILARGLQYVAPPSGGKSPLSEIEIGHEDLGPNVSISQVIGRKLTLSRKYVELALRSSGIDPKMQSVDVSDDELVQINSNLKKLFKVVLESNTGFVYFQDSVPSEISTTTLGLQDYNERSFPTFNEAVDEAFSWQVVKEINDETSKSQASELEKLRKSLEEQKAALARTQRAVDLARRMAQTLANSPRITSIDDLLCSNPQLGWEAKLSERGGLAIRIEDWEFEVERPNSVAALVSAIFDISKSLDRKTIAIKSSQLMLEQKIAKLNEVKPAISTVVQRRKRNRQWYESYRWFKTSESLLAVGGRDASSNSNLLKRHLDGKDLVFHADIPGSPFFILKSGQYGNERSLTETAQATVCCSRAWSQFLGSADAYCVNPDQVSSSPPSGTFLPRGSFMVYGSKRFFKGIPLSYAVGIIEDDDDDGYPSVISGPKSAVAVHTAVFVNFIPSREKISDSAKAIKANLFSKASESLRQQIKTINLDEIIRAMPPGGCKITE
jgi:predicted ribosome quality control (RQC) complex YloA/Tae2 family protein